MGILKIMQYLKWPIVVGLLTIALLITSCDAADKPEQNAEAHKKASTAGFYKNYYEGVVSKEYKISMVLSLEDSDLKGYYSYRSVGKRINLSGSIEKGVHFTIKESVDNKETGEFRGEFTSAFDAAEGQWSSPDGKKQMPFKVKKLAEFKTITSDKFDVEIEYPQFVPNNNKALMQLNSTLEAKIQRYYQDFIDAAESEHVLFIIGPECQSDLDSRIVPEELVRESKYSPNPISKHAVASIEEAGSRWLITDRHKYSVRKEGGGLYVYFEDKYEFTKDFVFIFKTIDIAYFSDRLVSILASLEEYTGGNRLNRVYLPYNFRLNNDSVLEIKLSDLFERNSDYLKTLSDLCILELEKQDIFMVGEDPGQKKDLEKDLDTYLITHKGLKFFFYSYIPNQYDSATISYEAMEKIIAPDGPLPYR